MSDFLGRLRKKINFQENIQHEMFTLHEAALNRSQKLREDFNADDYQWNVSSKIFYELQSMIPDYILYNDEQMKVFGIVVNCCPMMKGIELVHIVGRCETL